MMRNPNQGWPVLALGLVWLTSSVFAADLVNGAEPDWWLTPRRMIQTNLREIDAGMDVEAYVASLKAAGANVVLFNVGGIVANYPTDLAYHYRNPFLKGDLVGEVVQRLHAEGIRVIARFDFSKISERIADAHPEWLTRDANGDGVGSAHVVEDCFLRTADDCSYVKGDRRRCVFWKDVNAAVFHMANVPSKFPIVIEDCDVLYLRNKNPGAVGSAVFAQRGEGLSGQQKVNVLVRNIRIEDKFPTTQVFVLFSESDSVIGKSSRKQNPKVGSSYSGITFQNISAAANSIVGLRNVLRGSKDAPWSNITLDNVVIAGKKLTSLKDFAHVNEHVTKITFK